LQEQLRAVVTQIPKWRREARAKVKTLDRDVARFAVSDLVDEIKERFAERPAVLEHLDALREDVVEHARLIIESLHGGPAGAGAGEGPDDPEGPDVPQTVGDPSLGFRRYQVNVLVENGAEDGAPVVFESNPSYANLVGRIEHVAQAGTLITDHNLIKAGALHKANGGFLLLDARRLLTEAAAWEALKRTLSTRQLRVEGLGRHLQLVSTVSLDPEPVDLDVKVILLGDRTLYYSLHELDPDFSKLFKVPADLDERVDLSHESCAHVARLVAEKCRDNALLPFGRDAVGAIIERAGREADDSEKLSVHMGKLADLCREADYCARKAGRELVGADDVREAHVRRLRRSDRVREQIHEQIERGTVMVDTEGEAVGQVNGLSVLQIGELRFGQPSRITATARLGAGSLVDIEREAKLGGPLHSKGVLILTSFLGSRFGQERTLSLAASLVFEQSYGQVDGDSASMAELVALLSALAELPIKQSLAMTGSVDQRGRSQAIGGANEKIEGFYDICKARGLTGDQGVVIPRSNVKHLMLRPDVVAAVEEGRFAVYAIDNVDEAVEVMTGVAAGSRGADGSYPEASVNGRVAARLLELAELRRKQAKGGGDAEEKVEGEDKEDECGGGDDGCRC
jgi:lon-related putative ATP-dependent protease